MLFFIIIFSAMLGSFANVCIYRIPLEKSIVMPFSFCPLCKTPIKFYDNIPLVSFFLLKGKCRFCKGKISYAYPLVEFIITGGAVWLFLTFGLSINFFIGMIFLWILTVISVIDYYHQIIPDELSFLLIALGLFFSFFNPFLENFLTFIFRGKNNILWGRFSSSFLGFLLGGGIMYLIAVMGEIIFKREVMGGGDVKLIAGIGAFLGIEKVFDVLFLACLGGTIIGIFLRITGKNKKWQPIPFGPFLCASAVFFLDNKLNIWYF
ncbi:prepilin peptidase [bacterium]|nr:prepilin peptidase [bacterium]